MNKRHKIFIGGVVLVAAITFVIAGLNNMVEETKELNSGKLYHGEVTHVKQVRWEGCQYVYIVIDSQVSGLAHRGDCDNPIHKK